MEKKFKVGDLVHSKLYNKLMLVKSMSILSIVSYGCYNLWNGNYYSYGIYTSFDQGSPVGNNCIKIPNELLPILYGIECE